MLRWLIMGVLVLGAGARLVAVDELDAWDDFDSYGATASTPATINALSGSQFSGGDGWATSGGDIGWEVDPLVGGATAQVYFPSLAAASGGNLETNQDFVLRRVLQQTMTPTAAAPVWIGFQLQTSLESDVSTNLATCLNSIQFLNGASWSGSVLQFSMNTEGTRVDGVAGDLGSALRWRVNQTDDAPSSVLAVDSNVHLVVMELQTTQLSLWIYPSTTVTGIPFQTSASLGSALSFNRIQVQAAVYTFHSTQIDSILAIDQLAIGTSQAAVTSALMPQVAAIAPASAVNTGGDLVTITGAGFAAPMTVSFGGVASPSVSVASSTTLQVMVPADAVTGLVDVIVANGTGQARHAQGFSYSAPTSSDPQLTAIPVITAASGLLAGDVLGASSGIWSPQPAGFTYQWQTSSDGVAADAVDLPGQGSASYTLTSADAGMFLRVVVSPQGVSHPAASAFLAIPTYTSVAGAGPTISGSTQLQGVLAASPGSWTPTPPAFIYQWQGSADGLTGITAIAGAVDPLYSVQASDLGTYLRVAVTAQGSGSTAFSAFVFIPIPTLRAGSGPAISGAAQLGGVLTGTTGTWNPVPISFAYQWQGSPTGLAADAVAIPGETTLAHTVGPADVGEYLRLEVTAAGVPPAYSAFVLIATPNLLSAPVISGASVPGGLLSTTSGRWTPPPPAFTYQWQSASDAQGSGVTDIVDANQATYRATLADLGRYLRASVAVTGTGFHAESAFVECIYTKTDAVFIGSAGTVGPKCGLSAGVALLLALGFVLLRPPRRR